MTGGLDYAATAADRTAHGQERAISLCARRGVAHIRPHANLPAVTILRGARVQHCATFNCRINCLRDAAAPMQPAADRDGPTTDRTGCSNLGPALHHHLLTSDRNLSAGAVRRARIYRAADRDSTGGTAG